jgi:hypothetical protein
MGMDHAMMSKFSETFADGYIIQLLLVTLAVTAVVWPIGKLARLQVLAWSILVAGIYMRYGYLDQLVFYSNDQQHHAGLVDRLLAEGIPTSPQWWLVSGRIPFVLPATLLAIAGINTALALKTVSLVSYLYLSHLLLSTVGSAHHTRAMWRVYICSLGVVGVFFASLALRETTIMLSAALFVLHRSPSVRIVSFVCLVLLRPHLAAAFLIGWVIADVLRALGQRRWTPFRAALSVIIGSYLGYLLFSFGLSIGFGQSGTVQHQWGREPIQRIASNFVGLQFLAAPESSVPLSLTSLTRLRVLMSETIVIPLLFISTCLVSSRLSHLGRIVLWSFAIYVGLVTNTEFNSFRQNIAFMPLMGVVIADSLSRLKTKSI